MTERELMVHAGYTLKRGKYIGGAFEFSKRVGSAIVAIPAEDIPRLLLVNPYKSTKPFKAICPGLVSTFWVEYCLKPLLMKRLELEVHGGEANCKQADRARRV